MLTLIDGLPADVLGVEVSGKVTHRDYRDVLIPRAEAMLMHGPMKMLYVADNDLAGFELEALWDDAAFGVKHWRGLARVAVVADHTWLRGAFSLFAPLFPGEARLFALADLAAAKDWIASPMAGHK